ncbi:MAG: twin-arginine translocation signal domain-containing protein, partial [Bacteroidetes bacterium]|nr:twin-arginine translocation signal domain-containing protein [Bacteroidota bacterium]
MNKIQNPSCGVTRRDFVKTSAAVVGTLMASRFPTRASAYYPSNDEIRIGLIGCGGRGTGAAVQALSTKQNVKLVAMADAFADRIEESYANITDEAADHSEALEGRVDVPEERRFAGFDGYKGVIPLV